MENTSNKEKKKRNKPKISKVEKEIKIKEKEESTKKDSSESLSKEIIDPKIAKKAFEKKYKNKYLENNISKRKKAKDASTEKKINNNVLFNRVTLNSALMFIFIFSTEMIIRGFNGAKLIDISIIRILLSTLIISSVIGYLGKYLPKLGQRIFNIILVLIIGIYEFAEFGLSNFIGFYMGIGNAEQGTKVTSYIMDFLKALKPEHWTILIPTVLFLIYFIFFDKKVNSKLKSIILKNTKKRVLVNLMPLIIIILLSSMYFFTIKSEYFQDDLQTESNYTLWLYPENSNLTVNNFGVLVYGFCDIKSQIQGIDADYIMKLEQEENKEKEEEKEVEETSNERIIDDTAWNTLNANTNDSTYKTLNDYFMNREISDKNEMTGIFEGKNLIVILMESVDEIAIMNQEDFPTLYKMYHEGISFQNNYSPRNTCSTGNNEFTVLSSLFTINNTCTANAYATNKYFEGAFNMFNQAGYYTSAYHDYTQKYYKRATILPNLGAQKYYGVTDLGMTYDEKYEEWPSDVDFYKAAQSHYMSEEKFMTYLASVSTHQTYNVPSTLGDLYKDEFIAKGYSTSLSRYLSKMKVLDQALEELLNELQASGKLENTVIALFGDHFPYGLTDSQINEYLKANNAAYTVNRNSVTNKDVDRTPLVIYNAGMEPKVVTDYTTIIDLLPTLLNMFGIDYDPRLYLGTDIFSTSHKSRSVFADGSWADERGYYHAPNSKMNYKEGATEYTTEEIKEINKEISTRQKMSASAIKSNYFKYLGNGLEKYKVTTTTVLDNITEETVVNNQ